MNVLPASMRTDRRAVRLRRTQAAHAILFIALIALTGTVLTCDAETTMETRPCVLAGTWYPEGVTELSRSVDEHLASGTPLADVARARPIALIAPHAGHRWSGDGAGHVYRLIQGEAGRDIERVILIGPSHYKAFRGAAVSQSGAYTTPLGSVPVDREVTKALLSAPLFSDVPEAEREEHCIEIQLPFLQRALSQRFKLVPIIISHTDPAGWQVIARALLPYVDEHTLIVISSDFTHYGSRFGYLPFDEDVDLNLRRLDKGALAAIVALDTDRFAAYKNETDISVCGAHPIGALLALLRLPEFQQRWNGGTPEARVLDYYRSADLIGDYDGSVSYAAVAFFPPGALLPGPMYPELLRAVHVAGEEPSHAAATAPAAPTATLTSDPAGGGAEPLLNDAEQSFLIDLVRRTIRETVQRRPAPRVDAFPAGVSEGKLRAPSGVFVTLTERGQLRGCIGHILAQAPLVDAVIENAISAAFHDPRFAPVSASEVEQLHLEISVLTPLRTIAGPKEIVIGRDGVLLEKGGRRAVFLPQVAPEQGWDCDTMLNHLAMKAGLPQDAWRSGAHFQVFEAFVFEEKHR
jgi:AmmeMemoRadiSam system protein B/AmmeMemoRadiSam system protein A